MKNKEKRKICLAFTIFFSFVAWKNLENVYQQYIIKLPCYSHSDDDY